VFRFSPDGNWLVACLDGSRTFVVWDATTRTVAFTGEAKEAAGADGEGVNWIEFPTAGVVALFGDPGAELWDLRTRKQVRTFEMPRGGGTAAAVSPNGRQAAVAHDGRVSLYDLATGKRLPICDPQPDVQRLHGFTLAGRVRFDLGHPGEDAVRRLEWDAFTGRTTSLPPPRAVPADVSWSPDQCRYATLSDTTATVFDADTGRRVCAIPVRGRTWQVQPAGERVFVWGDNDLLVWGTDGRLRSTIPIGPVQDIGEFDPREYHLLPGGDAVLVLRRDTGPGRDSTDVSVWDAETGRARGRSLLPGSWTGPRLLPDGRRVLLWTREPPGVAPSPPTVFDVASGRKLVRLAGHTPGHQDPFSPDARTLAVLGRDVELVEMATGRVRAQFKPVGGIESIHFSPDGRWLVTDGSMDAILAWDIRGEFDRPKQQPDDAALEAAWAALAGDDAMVAFAAIRLLAAFPDRSVPFLKRQPAPAVATDPKLLHALVADLDHAAFAERERAAAELTRYGAGAERALREAVRSHTSAEVRKRAADLLDRIAAGKLTPDEVRAVRIVEAVEWMGTPDAVKLLEAWAGGAAGARLTEEAKTALSRIGRR
jgi:WD40 repeat protein